MLSPQIRGGAIWWMRMKAKGRHGVVCRLNCVIHVWAPWGRVTCHDHLGCYINPRTFYLLPLLQAKSWFLWASVLVGREGCISFQTRPKWVLNFTVQDCRSVLPLLPSGFIFQQDDTPAYTAKLAQDWIATNCSEITGKVNGLRTCLTSTL